MTVEYTITYNQSIKESLAPFFDLPHPWDVKPLEAVRHSARGVHCDARRSSLDAASLSVKEFLAILVSALPRCPEHGNIVGFSRVQDFA